MYYSSVAVLVRMVLAAISVVFGAKYKQGKGKAEQLTELLKTVVEAAEDDKVTEKEFQEIVASAKSFLEKPEAETA